MSELKITSDELSFVDDNMLQTNQLKFLLSPTPPQYVKTRPAKGGGTWTYVSGGYIRKVLNLMFGWDWDFEILDEKILEEEIVVKGRLTCRINGKAIIKTQYGNKDLARRKAGKKPLSIGNDLKAAATDALKKCASEIGISADVYYQDDFRPVNVDDITLDDLEKLYQQTETKLSKDLKDAANRIMTNQEVKSYNKLYSTLKNYLS